MNFLDVSITEQLIKIAELVSESVEEFDTIDNYALRHIYNKQPTLDYSFIKAKFPESAVKK